MTSELISALEKDRSGLLLRVTAHMFRQQSDLLEQQAAVLERMATNPCSPSSWVVDEPSPESRQRQQVQESATALAVKSYESMLQVQKRVDYLERLLARNGIKRIIRKPMSDMPKQRKVSKDSKTAFYWFRQQYAPAIVEEIGASSLWDNAVRQRLLKLWSTMNPQQRLPFWEKAQAEAAREKKEKSSAKHSGKKKSSGDADSRRKAVSYEETESNESKVQSHPSTDDQFDPKEKTDNGGNDEDSVDENLLIRV
jgi:histone H3/H4